MNTWILRKLCSYFNAHVLTVPAIELHGSELDIWMRVQDRAVNQAICIRFNFPPPTNIKNMCRNWLDNINEHLKTLV
jgi:hypothetical protein